MPGNTHRAPHERVIKVVVLIQQTTVGCITDQLERIRGVLVPGGLGFHTAVENIRVGLRRRDITARVAVDCAEVWVIASNVLVPNPARLALFPKEVRNSTVNTTESQGDRAIPNHEFQLGLENLFVRNRLVV